MPKVMLIDDDAGLLQAVSIRLRSAGIDVLTVQHPDCAANLVLRERPDLIVLDIDMPGFSGLDFHECLRVADRGCNIPVVYLSGRGTPANLEDAFRLGAKAFIRKPYQPGEFLAIVTGVLSAAAAAASDGA